MRKVILSILAVLVLFFNVRAMVIFLPEGCEKEGFDCTNMQCYAYNDHFNVTTGMAMDMLGYCVNDQYVVVQVKIYYNNYRPTLGGVTSGTVHAEGWFLRNADGSISDDTYFILINGGESVDYQYKPGKWIEITSDPSEPLMWQIDSYYGISSYGVVIFQIGVNQQSYYNFEELLGVFF